LRRLHYSLEIALRHLRTKRRSGFVSRVTLIAIGGTFVGVTTLIIVLSLMNGFEEELRSRIVGFNTHVLFFTRTREGWRGIDSVASRIESIPDVISSAPFIRGEALVYYELIPGVRAKTKGIIIKGVDLDKERTVSTVVDSITPDIRSFQISGFERDLPGVVLGQDMASNLHVGIGEEVTLVSAPVELTGGKMEPRTRDFRVVGFFSTGVYEFDSRFGYIDIEEAKSLFDFKAATRGLGIKIDDIYQADKVDQKIDNLFPSYIYGTNNWINMNRNLFSYIKVEKILMFLLLTLIILVAAFNLVGMLTMLIMEKRSEIGILRSMGASSGGIMSIFMIEGTLIGSIGSFAGAMAGLAICAVLKKIEIDLPPDVYFINTLPVLVKWIDVVVVVFASMAITFLTTIYPSWEACKMAPLDVIRYN
jgi:lipoprotein-releasing system permease protein